MTGLKGAGKTALLRYLEILAKREGNVTSFVLFKSDLKDQDRENISKAAGLTLADDNTKNKGMDQDFRAVWDFFFHRYFCDILSENYSAKYASDPAQDYISFVQRIAGAQNTRAIKRVFPKIKDNKIEVQGDISPFKARFEGSLEMSGDGKQVNLRRANEIATEILETLNPIPYNIYIFVDELELFLGSEVDYDRDSRIISDILLSATEFNQIFRRMGLSIKIVLAVRSEVLRAMHARKHELNRIADDFGVHISWAQKGRDDSHPLLKLVENRIRASYDQNGYSGPNSVWFDLFPKNINGVNPRRYIMHKTWYRPRDIVRMMSLARDHQPDAKVFTRDMFDDTARDYSERSWDEMVEELSASYNMRAIEGIRIMFSGMSNPVFTLEDIKSVAQKKAGIDPRVHYLLEVVSVENLLHDLFRVGVVGNEDSEPAGHTKGGRRKTKPLNTWSFRGDRHLFLEKKMTVHRGIRAAFSIR